MARTAKNTLSPTCLKAKERRVVRHVVAIFVLLLGLFVVELCKLSPAVSQFFAKWISRPYRTAVGFFTSLFPFSVTEVLVVVAILCGIVFVASLIRCCVVHKKYRIGGKIVSFILVVCCVITLYSVTAGFDYARPAIKKPWAQQTASVEEYQKTVFLYAKEAGELSKTFAKNADGTTLCPYTFAQMAKIMQAEVQRYAGGDYGWYAPLPKAVANSWEMDLTAILGITFAPTNEVNLNKNISDLALPYTMAHELAHAMGVMSEREANLFAAFCTLHAQNDFVRYSGYLATIGHLLPPLLEVEVFQNPNLDQSILKKDFLTAIGEDFRKDARLSRYNPQTPAYLSNISEFLNDLYLKMSGIPEGTNNYNTGRAEVTLPPTGSSAPPTIAFSEVQKIYLYLQKNL